MSEWEILKAEAIAIYSYDSILPNHLRLLPGDVLEISEKCGGWVKAKCMATSVIGICPLNHISIASNNSQTSNFDLLLFEVRCVFRFIFSRVISKKHLIRPEEAEIFDLIKRIQELIPLASNPESRIDMAKNLDELRLKSELPVFPRYKTGTIMDIHNVTRQMLSVHTDSQRSETVSPVGSSIFPATFSIQLSLSFSYHRDVWISARLISITENSNDFQCLSSPSDYIQLANSHPEKVLKFYNIPNSHLKNLGLIIRLFSTQKYVDVLDKDGNIIDQVDGREYLGVSMVRFINEKELSFRTTLNFALPFYSLTEGSFIEVPSVLMNNSTSEHLARVADLPQISIKIMPVESNGEAVVCDSPESIQIMSIPMNISPSFSCNNYYIKLISLHQRIKYKRLRVTFKIYNWETMTFLNCFKHTLRENEFSTAIQKGPCDLLIDEYAEIDMNSENFDPIKCNLIIEVHQLSKSRQTCNLVLYSVFKLTDAEGIIKDSKFGQLFSLPLHKPLTKNIDYTSVSESDKMTQNRLLVSLSLVSTTQSSDPLIYKIMHWGDYKQSFIDNSEMININSLNFRTVMVYMTPLNMNLIEMMADKELESYALNSFITIIMMVDMYRSDQFKYFFHHFVSTMFTSSSPQMAGLYSYMLTYLANSLIDDPNKDHSGEKTKMNNDACRCLSYFLSLISASLNLNKLLNQGVDSTAFQASLQTIVNRLAPLMETDKATLISSKSFAMRSFPKFCDIIASIFPSYESSQLILPFLRSVKNDPSINSNQNAARQNRILLYRNICETECFLNENNRRFLLPFILDDVKLFLNDDRDKPEIIQILISIFFAIKGTSSSFTESVVSFNDFILPLIDFSKRHEMSTTRWVNQPYPGTQFLILLLYYSDPLMTQTIITNSLNPYEVFHSILNLIHKVIVLNPPPFILFATIPVFITVAKLSLNPSVIDLSRQQSKIEEIINLISNFYTQIQQIQKDRFSECDLKYFKRAYSPRLDLIAELLPKLLKFAPNSIGFSTSVLTPLFHLFVTQKVPSSQNMIIDSFFMIINSDFKRKGNFFHSENAILAMDSFSRIGQLDDTFNLPDIMSLFDRTWLKFGTEEKNPIIVNFFTRMKDFVTFLASLSTLASEDEISSACIANINTLDPNDLTLFPHILSLLYSVYMNPENSHFVEAAETLVLCAKRYRWDDTTEVPSQFNFPPQRRNKRKAEMMCKAIDLFIKDDFYERALDVVNELRSYYEYEGDFEKLNGISQVQSICYDLICTKERTTLNRFYGVRFFGNTFNQFDNNALYIYRRNGFYMATQMMQEMKDNFPHARVEHKPPTLKDFQTENLAYIHVFNVKPVDNSTFNPLDNLAEVMAKSCLTVQTFYSETPVRIKRSDIKVNEMAEWHRQILTFRTELPLQGISRRSRVVTSSDALMMSPIECAISDTNAKTMELLHAACAVWRGQRFNVDIPVSASSSLRLLIQGIVNAAVNGGTKVFQDLFLEGPLSQEKNNMSFREKLILAFKDQLKAVNFALKVHTSIMNEFDAPLHENWEHSFIDAQNNMKNVIGDNDLNEQLSFGTLPSLAFLELYDLPDMLK